MNFTINLAILNYFFIIIKMMDYLKEIEELEIETRRLGGRL